MSTLDETFTATLVKSPKPGGHTYVVWPARPSSSAPGGW